MKAVYYILFLCLLTTACRSSSDNKIQPKVTTLVKIPIEKIGPGRTQTYEEWSVATQDSIERIAPVNCVNGDDLIVALESNKNISTVSKIFNLNTKINSVHASYSDARNLCDYSGDDLEIEKSINIIKKNNNPTNVFTYGYFGVYSAVDFKKNGDGEIVTITYPKKYNYIDEDLAMRLSLMEKRLGKGCCILAND